MPRRKPGQFRVSYIDPELGLRVPDAIGHFFCFRESLDRQIKMRLAWEPYAWRDLGIDRSESILDYAVDRPEFLEDGLVPISDNGSGDLICLDYRGDHRSIDPPIVLWRHEFVGQNPVVFLADNFEAFVKGLEFSDVPALLDELEQGE